MNLGGVGEFAPVLATGAVLLSESFNRTQWHKLDKFLKTKESMDDFAKFRYFATDVFSSALLSVIAETKFVDVFSAEEEQKVLQNYYFYAYLQTCDFIQHDSDLDQIIRDDVLDLQNFYNLGESDVSYHLDRHISKLKDLYSIHQFYAYRKSLAKCDFIKWNSDFDEIFEKLKSENMWSELPNSYLSACLDQHFLLLHRLKNGGNIMGSVSNFNTPEWLRSHLLEAINEEYSEKLANTNKEFVEMRTGQYLEHFRFKNLVAKRVVEAQQLSTLYFAEAHQWSTESMLKRRFFEKLSQLKNGAKSVSKSWVLDKMSRLKDQVGRKTGGQVMKRLSGFILGAATLTALATSKGKV
ncbi:hypothetical protein F0562_027475 [Nyssa sinensis]|uniref:Uncharacterized protein n=1 Tax=Nyssa sinensis TaxID=561372 RepID=A0A5J5B3V5_9ASTE|nr:hypothetical protein F0562_027475 [Nyssa sinensis]